MIVVDELVKMVGYSVWISFVFMVSVLGPTPVVHYTGKPFLEVVQYLSSLGVIYSYLGGTGIAIFRLLYIRFSSWIQHRATTVAMAIMAVLITAGGIQVLCITMKVKRYHVVHCVSGHITSKVVPQP